MAVKKQSASKETEASTKKNVGKSVDSGKSKDSTDKPKKTKKLRGCIFYIIIAVIVLGILTSACLAAAVYLGFVDVQETAEKFQLHKYPVIGKYFPQVETKTNFEPVPLDETEKPVPDKSAQSTTPAVTTNQNEQKNNLLTAEDIVREENRKKEEAAKKMSRMARLYGEMKAKDAAEVLKELDDTTIISIFNKMEDDQVAKILSIIDAPRAARLTQEMIKGQNL